MRPSQLKSEYDTLSDLVENLVPQSSMTKNMIAILQWEHGSDHHSTSSNEPWTENTLEI
jgi:hypothetical protein